MPVVLTKPYADRIFFVSWSGDKDEGIFTRPMTETRRKKVRERVNEMVGGDPILFAVEYGPEYLSEALTGWKTYTDVAGNAIPYSQENLKEICECDPAHEEALFHKVNNVARLGELVDEKN